MSKFWIAALVIVLLGQLSDHYLTPQQPDTNTQKKPNSTTITSTEVCRAAIAAIMDQNPSIISVTQTVLDTLYLAYERPSDSTRWENKCKIRGNQVVWGVATGRWRTEPLDGVVTYHYGPQNSITIIENHSDGAITKKSFTRGF